MVKVFPSREPRATWKLGRCMCELFPVVCNHVRVLFVSVRSLSATGRASGNGDMLKVVFGASRQLKIELRWNTNVEQQ